MVDSSVTMLLSQVYPNLVAIAISVIFDKGSLTLFDVHYALALAASPVTIYVVVSAYLRLFHLLSPQKSPWNSAIFRDECNTETQDGWTYLTLRTEAQAGRRLESLINRQSAAGQQYPESQKEYLRFTISTTTLISLVLSLLLPWLWIALQATVSFSTTAFSNSQLCNGMTLSLWFEFQFLSSFIGILDQVGMRNFWDDVSVKGGLGFFALITLVVCQLCLALHRNDIYREFLAETKRKNVHDNFSLWKLPKSLWTFAVVSW